MWPLKQLGLTRTLWCCPRAETIAEPYYTFRRKGYRVVMASIRGGPIPIDPASVAPQNVKTHSVKLFLADRARPSPSCTDWAT